MATSIAMATIFLFHGLINIFMGSQHSIPLHRLELISFSAIPVNKCCHTSVIFCLSHTLYLSGYVGIKSTQSSYQLHLKQISVCQITLSLSWISYIWLCPVARSVLGQPCPECKQEHCWWWLNTYTIYFLILTEVCP